MCVCVCAWWVCWFVGHIAKRQPPSFVACLITARTLGPEAQSTLSHARSSLADTVWRPASNPTTTTRIIASNVSPRNESVWWRQPKNGVNEPPRRQLIDPLNLRQIHTRLWLVSTYSLWSSISNQSKHSLSTYVKHTHTHVTHTPHTSHTHTHTRSKCHTLDDVFKPDIVVDIVVSSTMMIVGALPKNLSRAATNPTITTATVTRLTVFCVSFWQSDLKHTHTQTLDIYG